MSRKNGSFLSRFKKNGALTCMVLFILFYGSMARAYKINTHVYVGNEVLKSVEACTNTELKPCVYIDVVGEKKLPISIAKQVYNSLKKYPDAYLLGNYGPDAFPDMIAGQTVIHPGINDSNTQSWGTGDWVHHMLTSAKKSQNLESISLSYGFAAHAAADTFAHTYVNQFSGGIFSFTDEETEIDERHNLLESLIGKYTPELPGGTYNRLIAKYERPSIYNFAYETLVKDSDAKRELNKVASSSLLTFMQNIYDEIGRALYIKPLKKTKWDEDRILELFTGGVDIKKLSLKEFIEQNIGELKGAGLVQIIEIYAAHHFASTYLGLKLKNDEAQKLTKFASDVHDKVNQGTLGAVDELHRFEKQLNRLEGEIVGEAWNKINELKKVLKPFFKAEKKFKKERNKVQRQINRYNKKISDAQEQIDQFVSDIERDIVGKCRNRCEKRHIKSITVPSICTDWRWWGPKFYSCNETITNPAYQICMMGCHTLKDLKEKLSKFRKLKRNLTREKRKLVQRAEKLQKQFENKFDPQKIDELMTGVVEVIYVYSQEVREKFLNARGSANQQLKDWTLSFRKLIERQHNDVQLAIKKYIEANVKAMTNSMNTAWWAKGTIKDGNSSILKPYMEWVFCYGPVVAAGIPASTGEYLCKANIENFDKFSAQIGQFENQLLNLHSVGSLEPLGIKEHLIEEGPYKLMEVFQNLLDNFANVLGFENPLALSRFHNGFKFNGDDDQVDRQFAKPETKLKLSAKVSSLYP